MKTYLDCIPCFYRQALDAARIAGTDEIIQKKIIDELSQLIPNFSLEIAPPEMGREIYSLVGKISGVKDPFKEIKENSNKFALKLFPKLKQEINNSEDGLLTALKLSIIGNIIDYGAKNSLDVPKEISYLFQGNFIINNENNSTTFKYNQFKESLNKTNTIIYLADNAGEVVFDRLLIEELVKELGKEVIYVVKGKPIINDALIEDALFCGINRTAKVISSGSDAPGTLLKYCSPEFIRLYQKAELIISKGQGNYEYSVWMYGERRPILIDLVIWPDMDFARMKYEDIHRDESTITAETRVVRPDGTEMTLSLVASPLFGPEGETAGAIESIRDITRMKETEEELAQLNENLEQMVSDRTQELEEEVAARKKAEQVIRASLDEKVVLLREIHHRVKNNLQIIISLMNLQIRKASDPNVKVLLQETQDRVRAMSLVHEKLYGSEDLARIDLSAYLNSLIRQLFATHGEAAQKVTLHMEFDRIMTEINVAIPLGLIMNELISNAMKHAFPGDVKGNVTIRGRTAGGEIRISYEDDGVGFPPGFSLHEVHTLGLHLVTSLVRQLDSTIEKTDTTKGVSFSIVIPCGEKGVNP